MLVRKALLQGECAVIVVADPLVVPCELHCAGTSLDEAGGQVPLLDDALDLAATENSSLGRTMTGNTRAGECTIVVHAVRASGRISSTIVGQTEGELARIHTGGPQSFQVRIDFFQVGVRADFGSDGRVALVPRTVEVVRQDIEPIDMLRQRFDINAC